MIERQKQTIRDMRACGLAYRIIAETVDLSQNTVKSFCHRENISDGKYENFRCKNCGKILTHIYGKKKKRYCSDKCRSDWWNRNRRWARQKTGGYKEGVP